MPNGEYRSIHSWIQRHYGKAFLCENECGTTTTKFQYALLHGKEHSRDRSNYKMLCSKCHHSYDELKTSGPLHPMWGRKHTEDSKRKMSISRMGNKNMLGKKLSEATRKKMSLARKGVPKSEEHKRKIGLAHKGRTIPPDRVAKMKETLARKKLQRQTPIHSRGLTTPTASVL